MSWSGVGSFVSQLFKSRWFKEQSPIVVVLFLLLIMGYQYAFHYQPEERKENRATWQQLRKDIQDGHQKIEEQHTKQVDRISDEFHQARSQDYELIRSLLEGKAVKAKQALKDIGESLSSSVSTEPD